MFRNAVLLIAASCTLGAQQGAQLIASLGDFKLESGQVIRDCRIGYRTYGQLDAAKSNAILFPTWFGGTTEQLAGNFGSGKMIDTGKYFVIAVDAIGNGVSTSPSNSRTQHAHEVSALLDPRYGGKPASPGDRSAASQSPASGDRDFNGRHADV